MRRTLTRRRALAAALVASTAGCTGLGGDGTGEDGGDGSSDDTDGGTDGSDGDPDDGTSTDGDGTDGESGSDGDGEDDGTDTDDWADYPLAFGNEVGEETRTKARRALERTREIVGEELDDEVTIQFDEPGFLPIELLFPDSGPLHHIGRMAHREGVPEEYFGATGSYGNDTITLVDPDYSDELTPIFQELAPVEIPDDVLEDYVGEALIAHELTHAIQGDVTDFRVGIGYQGSSYDGRQAGRSVGEGTAEYVGGRYRAECLQGEYDECEVLEIWLNAERTPLWGVHLQMWYINGMIYTYYLREDGGWDAIWDAHADPPKSAWATMFPAQFFTDPIGPAELPPQKTPPTGWDSSYQDRLGVNTLYEKLYRLEQVSPLDEDARVASEVTAATGAERMFRSELLRGWRNDRFTVFEHESDGDRVAGQWLIQLDSSAGASDLASAFEAGYGTVGTQSGDAWHFRDDYFTVDTESETVELWMAPDTDALEAFNAGSATSAAISPPGTSR